MTHAPDNAADSAPDPAQGAVTTRRLHAVAPLDSRHAGAGQPAVPPVLRAALFGGAPCYALLDAAKHPLLAELIETSGCDYRCLFTGRAGNELRDVAPYLLRLTEDGAFTRRLFTATGRKDDLWRAAPGIFLRGAAGIDALHAHLRRFTRIRDEDGAWLYFRFWEPEVAGVYFPELDDRPDLARRWFHPAGAPPIEAIVALVPDRDPDADPPLADAVIVAPNALAPGPGPGPGPAGAALLSRHDMNKLRELRHRADVDGFARNLRETFGPDIAMDDAALRTFTTAALRRLLAHGFRQRDNLCVLLAWEVFFGPGFERYDPTGELSRILHDGTDEEERFLALKARMETLESTGAGTAQG